MFLELKSLAHIKIIVYRGRFQALLSEFILVYFSVCYFYFIMSISVYMCMFYALIHHFY